MADPLHGQPIPLEKILSKFIGANSLCARQSVFTLRLARRMPVGLPRFSEYLREKAYRRDVNFPSVRPRQLRPRPQVR